MLFHNFFNLRKERPRAFIWREKRPRKKTCGNRSVNCYSLVQMDQLVHFFSYWYQQQQSRTKELSQGLDRSRYVTNLRKWTTHVSTVLLSSLVLLPLFVLSNQHFVTHFKFNFVLYIIQNLRWQKNCRNMFLKSVVHFLKLSQAFKFGTP